MADKFVIYNPESNDASHTPTDKLTGDFTIHGNIDGISNLFAVHVATGQINAANIFVGNVQISSDITTNNTITLSGPTSDRPTITYSDTGITITDSKKQPSENVILFSYIDGNTMLTNHGDIIGSRWWSHANETASLYDYINKLTGGDLTSGWTRLQNGLLLQWGTAISKTGYAGWTYPTAFTKVCKLFTTLRDVWGANDHIPIAYPDLSLETETHNNLTIGGAMCRQVNGGSGVYFIDGGTCDWFAIGY